MVLSSDFQINVISCRVCLFVVVVALCGQYALSMHVITEIPSAFARGSTEDSIRTLIAVHEDASKLSLQQVEDTLASSPRVMTDASGTRFVCRVPPPPPSPPASAPLTPMSDAATLLPSKTPFELLESLTSLCLYRQEGLWTYEMCYKTQARQFRQDQGGAGEDFSCGKYTGDEEQSEEIKFDPSSSSSPIKYVSHTMSGGAACVMTGDKRTTEVRFTCMRDVSDNVIVSVKEFPTCNYVFTVATPFLCNHPEFKPQPERVSTINCWPETSLLQATQGLVVGRVPAPASQGVVAPGESQATPGQCAGREDRNPQAQSEQCSMPSNLPDSSQTATAKADAPPGTGDTESAEESEQETAEMDTSEGV